MVQCVSSLNFLILYGKDDFELIHCSFCYFCSNLEAYIKLRMYKLLCTCYIVSLPILSSLIVEITHGSHSQQDYHSHKKIYSYFIFSSFFEITLSVFLMTKHYNTRLCALIISCQINFFYPINKLSQKPF